MGCAVGKEIADGNKLDDNLPQLEAGTLVKKSKPNFEDFTVLKPEPVLKTPKYRTKIDSRVTSKYDVKALIGKGSFSDVLRVECKTSKQPYAIKVVKVHTLQEQEVVKSELLVLKHIDHQFVIKLYEVIISKECSYMVMELATGGELYDRIKSRGHLEEKYACNITQMVLSGITYLHSEGITHRDLKPENLLFYHPGNDSKILITDFGFAKILSDEKETLKTWCGTPEYIAPELLKKEPYGKIVDLWALGVIVYVMLSGHLPFSADTAPKLFKQIMDGVYGYQREVWLSVSEQAKDFIDKLLQVDPDFRMNANSASSHPWMSSYPPLHKLKNVQRSKKRLKAKISDLSTKEGFIPLTNRKRFSVEYDKTNGDHYDSNKLEKKPFAENARVAQNGLILPFTSDFSHDVISKDKILEDNGSTMSPSNIDSLLATEDTNSVASNLEMFQQFYQKYAATDDPVIREQMKHEYMQTLHQSNLRLPVQVGNQTPINNNGFTFPNRGSVKDRKRSVHMQFENIDEDPDNESLSTNTKMDLSKLDRIHASGGSLVSSPSFKSEHIPIETNLRSGYIEKVGVWLTDQEGRDKKGMRDKYSAADEFFTDGRTMSAKSNLTVSDHSQASSFNRFLLPNSSATQKSRLDMSQNISFRQNASLASNPTTEEITFTNSFTSSTAFQPLILENVGHASFA